MKKRLERELFWIDTLVTFRPCGLNDDKWNCIEKREPTAASERRDVKPFQHYSTFINFSQHASFPFFFRSLQKKLFSCFAQDQIMVDLEQNQHTNVYTFTYDKYKNE